MVYDSITTSAAAASAAKDFGKRKRANRSAKLKQCKLDARREQWLSQAVKNKGIKEELPAGQPPSSPPQCADENERKNLIVMENLETIRRGRGRGSQEDEKENNGGPIYHDFDSDSPSNSPSGTDGGTNFTGSSSSSSSSSTSSGGCCSGSTTEEEEGAEGEGEGDDNCLDDWEAVADALAAADDNKHGNHNGSPCSESSETSSQLEPSVISDVNMNNLGSNHDGERTIPPRTPGNSRAWRPDDAFRPQSLPNLSKQRSFPNADRHYGQHGGGFPWSSANVFNVPSSCPICCEELDGTDTSFLPCICGFRLCLFCYNRIRQVDGRCPGCRKNYEDNLVESELSYNGGCMTFRLPRSYSMVARSS